ncbi:MAG TPA: tRNA 2-thiouridine(34) synthase MnmA [Candidatus Babeliaceae bacterium]|nr:tRNA 2-thiouridine(34) synthase MnmA [Candidatus Babeliaceae bacterium]
MNIAVLVSGGVDSSVVLRLLEQHGHTVTAFYLKIWLEDELSYLGTCPWQEDLEYAQALCSKLEVPLEVVSFQKEYWQEVVTYTINEVKAGRTPNPDILCNQRVKFGAFYNKIGSEFEKVATGHYARVEEQDGLFYLHTAPDPIKDQTYFLSHLTQAQLCRALFPIGHLTKPQVREYAERYNLPTKARKDSQGICFLGKLKFSEFIRHHLGDMPGLLIEHETGKVLGEHKGFWYYTIGQRQGIGLSGGPWYVVAKKPEENTVFISRNYYSSEKDRNRLIIENCNWITGAPNAEDNLKVKLRHGPEMVPVKLESQPGDKFLLKLGAQDQGIAPGQFAVLYRNTECLGGGVII